MRSPKEYGRLPRLLYERGITELVREDDVGEVAGCFFVRKKGDRLRLILDCRHSNLHFRVPDSVQLCTGESLGCLEVGAHESLEVDGADLRDAFYHLLLPVEVRRYFCMRRATAGSVGLETLNGEALHPGRLLRPRVRVVPMGWNWALWWCQRIHEQIITRSGLPDAERLVDRRPAPPPRPSCHTAYVDNFIAFGTDRGAVEGKVATVMRHLEAAGLVVEREEPYDAGRREATVLGWQVQRRPVAVRPRRERLWRARLALRALVWRGGRPAWT